MKAKRYFSLLIVCAILFGCHNENKFNLNKSIVNQDENGIRWNRYLVKSFKGYSVNSIHNDHYFLLVDSAYKYYSENRLLFTDTISRITSNTGMKYRLKENKSALLIFISADTAVLKLFGNEGDYEFFYKVHETENKSKTQ